MARRLLFTTNLYDASPLSGLFSDEIPFPPSFIFRILFGGIVLGGCSENPMFLEISICSCVSCAQTCPNIESVTLPQSNNKERNTFSETPRNTSRHNLQRLPCLCSNRSRLSIPSFASRFSPSPVNGSGVCYLCREDIEQYKAPMQRYIAREFPFRPV